MRLPKDPFKDEAKIKDLEDIKNELPRIYITTESAVLSACKYHLIIIEINTIKL